MAEPHVYACSNLEIEAPKGFQVNTDMDAGWRPKYVEGDITLLNHDERVIVDAYDDGPLHIQSTMVRICRESEYQQAPYQRLLALIALGASGRQAHREAIAKMADDLRGVVEERVGSDPVLTFRVNEVLKRYAD